MIPGLARVKKKNNKFVNNLLIICRNMNLLKKN